MNKEQIALEITLEMLRSGKIRLVSENPPKSISDFSRCNKEAAEEILNVYKHLVSIQ